MVEVEWDPAKNEANLAKHGISFVGAATVFDGPILVTRSDRGGEIRFRAIGVLAGREIAVVYTMRGAAYRIISARRAREDERRAYRQIYP